MKILIVGCGKVGETLAAALSQEGNEITIIDKKESVVERICNQYDVMGFVGDGISYSIQQEADIVNTDLMIAVTQSDEKNLLCCLLAKKAGNCHTIARVRDPEFVDEVSFLKEELGLAMVINPEKTAAAEAARMLKFPSAIEIDTFSKGRVEILRLKVPEGSVLNNMNLHQMNARLKCSVLVCTVERNGKIFIPRGDAVLQTGDVISIVASSEDEAIFFRKIGVETNQVKNVMIAGGGEIGFYLAELLCQSGIRVKIIEKDAARCEELWELLPKVTIVHGNATDSRLLEEEDIDSVEGFAALTEMDEQNVILSMYAKRNGCRKTITKINRYIFENVLESLDLDSLLYPRDITAEYILQYVRAMKNSIGSNVETLHRIIDKKVEALEFVIRDNFRMKGVPLKDLHLKEDLLIACISRGGKVILPGGNDQLLEGDNVIVVTIHKGMLNDINDILA